MKKELGLFLLLLMVANTGFAQLKLAGEVVNGKSLTKVEYANLVVLSDDSLFVKGTVSDSLGSFTLDLPGDMHHCFLQVSHLNYKKKILQIHAFDDLVTVSLEEAENNMGEVKVFGKAKLLKNSLSGTEYLVTDNMRNASFLATQVLENIPNVFIDFNNNIYVKGSSKVLVLKNGIELLSNDLVDQISPKAIEKIEISTNLPSKYSARNYTALINIITKKTNRTNLMVSGLGSPENNFYDATVNLNIEKMSHSFYLYYKYYFRNFVEESSIRQSDLAANQEEVFNLRTEPRKDRDDEVYFGYNYQKNKKLTWGMDGYLSFYREFHDTKFEEPAENPFSLLKEKYNTQNYSTYLQLKDSVSSFLARASFTNKQLDDNLEYYKTYKESQISEQNRLNITVDYDRDLKNDWAISAGVDYNYVPNEGSYETQQDAIEQEYKENRVANYVDLTKEFDKSGFILGANFYFFNRKFDAEDIEINECRLYPKFTYYYQIDKINSLKLDVSSLMDNPTLWQMLTLPVQSTPTLQFRGNPYLKPEMTNTLSFEYAYSKSSTFLSTNVYYTLRSDKLVEQYGKDGDMLYVTYANIDRAEDMGMSASVNFNVKAWWKIRLFGDIYNRHIGKNEHFDEDKLTYNWSALGAWFIKKKIIVVLRYQYNGEYLTYNGKVKPYNNSIGQVRYNVNNRLSLSLLAVQPIGKFETKTVINNGFNDLKRKQEMDVFSLLLSVKFKIFKDKVRSQESLYYDEDKKY
ncbi:TonB-dependent receptor [Marinilabiliaceae bacterium JC017]|nr:TonB-dependent receptor [Marinilabiliaceae bacterium JC017]